MIFIISTQLSPQLLSTPFPIISSYLLKFDLSIGFNQQVVMFYLMKHMPWVMEGLNVIYNFWKSMILIVFAVSAHLDLKNKTKQMLVVAQFGIVSSVLIFYFLPTLSPVLFTKVSLAQFHLPSGLVALLTQAGIDRQQYALVQRGLSPFIDGVLHAGFIAFPSLHLHMVLALSYAAYKIFPRFQIAVYIFSFPTLLAIFSLGAHDLLDAVMSILLFYFGISLSKKITE